MCDVARVGFGDFLKSHLEKLIKDAIKDVFERFFSDLKFLQVTGDIPNSALIWHGTPRTLEIQNIPSNLPKFLIQLLHSVIMSLRHISRAVTACVATKKVFTENANGTQDIQDCYLVFAAAANKKVSFCHTGKKTQQQHKKSIIWLQKSGKHSSKTFHSEHLLLKFM